jgi:essential nuclear protein 1
MFIQTLLQKKYSLPKMVVDRVAKYFIRFTRDERSFPVMWHQALLVFVQRYKTALKPKQIAKIHLLLAKQHHRMITQEVKRELASVTGLIAKKRHKQLKARSAAMDTSN